MINSSINWSMANKCAFLSKVSYLKFEDCTNSLTTALEREKYELVRTFSDTKTHTQAFLCRSEDVYYLSFRGTEAEFLDILTDLKFRLQFVKGEKKHTGFIESYRSIRAEILDSIPTGKKVVLTGHSLGGALASISYFDLKEVYDVKYCYTFGEPPSGVSERECDHSDGCLFRFVNNSDIVPRIMNVGTVMSLFCKTILFVLDTIVNPFVADKTKFLQWKEWLSFTTDELSQYKHYHSGILLNGDGTYRKDLRFEFSIKVFLKVLFRNSSKTFIEHKMDNYEKAIITQLDQDLLVFR